LLLFNLCHRFGQGGSDLPAENRLGGQTIRPLLQKCENFYPSCFANPRNDKPRVIPLTRGKFAIVDAEDYLWLSKYNWFAEGTDRNFYAVRKEKTGISTPCGKKRAGV